MIDPRDDNLKTLAISDSSNTETTQNKDNSFFCIEEVEKGGYEPISIRFETLINAHCEAPFDWYKDLDLDKSYASKVRRGLIIPPKWMRIKIAQYFKVDSATIWTAQDLPYIKRIIKTQGGEK